MTQEEHHQAQLEEEQMIEEALDRCFLGKASRDDWMLIAWQAGATRWTPPNNVIPLRAQR